MKKTELRATDPSIAGLADINSTSTMNWDNQLVFATGMAYHYNDKLTLYAGYNYGKNPIPKEHTNPVVAGIFDHHLTFGGSYKYNSQWTLFGGIEYDFRKKVEYTNPELPFGNDAQLRNEAVWLHLMVSRQW